jgi:hypothetical protein
VTLPSRSTAANSTTSTTLNTKSTSVQPARPRRRRPADHLGDLPGCRSLPMSKGNDE